MGAPVINPDEFVTFVLVLLRVSLVVALAPIFGSTTVINQVKAAIVLMLTFMIAPQVRYPAEMMPMTWVGFIPLALGEIFFGFCLGFIVRLVTESANLAGDYISFQTGLSMANVMDPQSGAQVSMVSRLIYVMITLMFLYANGHMLVLKAMMDSFKVAPPGYLMLSRTDVFAEIMAAMMRLYVVGIKLCAPVIAVLFCVKVGFGIVAKAVPQMNILFVGMPVYILVGFSVMLFGMSWWPGILETALLEVDKALNHVLVLLSPPVPL